MWKETAIIVLIVITGSSWAYWQLFAPDKVTPADAAFNIFVQIIGTGLTILVLDQLWFAEERRKWKKIKDKVNEMFCSEISEIFADFSLIVIPPIGVTITSEEEDKECEEFERKTKEHQMSELDRLAEGDWKQIKQILTEEQRLLEGGYGRIFERRYANLNDIELKYGKFLDPSKLSPLIDLERLLKSLSGNINVRLKLKTQLVGAAFAHSYDDKIAYRVHEILKTLNEFKRTGILK